MKEIKSLLSEDYRNICKKTVYKLAPELKEHDLEADLQQELACPQCGRDGVEGGAVLVYRLSNKENWKRIGKIFKCSQCRDREALEDYMDKSLMDKNRFISERLMNDYLHIPEKLKEIGFKDYIETNPVTTSAKRETISYIKEFLSSNGKSYNLLIQGNPGTGKTHLCVAIARNLIEKGHIVGFLTTGQLLSKIKSTYNKAAMKTEENIIEDIKKLDLLILDDLGAEAIGGNSDWRETMILEIVESRSGKPTIYTSNLTDIDLPLALGKRTSSRLYDNTRFIDLFTEDYRKKLQIK